MNTFFKITGYILAGCNVASAWLLATSNHEAGAIISAALAWIVVNEARKLH